MPILAKFKFPSVLIMACIPVGAAGAATEAVSVTAAVLAISVRAPRSIPSGTPIEDTTAEGSAALPPRMLPKPQIPPTMPTIIPVRRIQSRNWVRATMATPIIYPNISSVDLTDDTRTSTTRLDFSSMTLVITIPQNIAMNI